MRFFYLLIILSLFFVAGCAKKTYETLYPTLNDGKYDSEFPYRNCSEQLEGISVAVKRIFCLADYDVYNFSPEQKFTPEVLLQMDKKALRDSAFALTVMNEASSGTATIIHYNQEKIALLSCAHVLNFPDTIFTHFDNDKLLTAGYVQGMAIKTKQRNFFRGHPNGYDLEILAINEDIDLAIIGKNITTYDEAIHAFPYPLGDSEQLEWGSFVYVMGYPLGYQMITRGIVSRPVHQKEESFLIDATFNEGFSGGIVLAIRDGVPNFELVGLGKSASVSFDNVLVPALEDHEKMYNPTIPYEGVAYVDLRKNVNYGITNAISTKAVRQFYRLNRRLLEDKGYFLGPFFEGEILPEE